MRVAIFSDVHGNLGGLEAVLADVARHAPDLVVFAGDLCLMGPRPGDCLRRVRELRLPAVMGNTDEWTAGDGQPPERMREVLPWTRDQLTGDERDWLAGLPFGLTVSPTADPADDLRIVHANPRDLNAILFPSETHQTAYWSAVRQSDAELEPLLGGRRRPCWPSAICTCLTSAAGARCRWSTSPRSVCPATATRAPSTPC